MFLGVMGLVTSPQLVLFAVTRGLCGRPLDSFACTPMLLVGYVSWGNGVGDFSPIGLVCGFQRAMETDEVRGRLLDSFACTPDAAGWVMLVGENGRFTNYNKFR